MKKAKMCVASIEQIPGVSLRRRDTLATESI